MCVCVQACSRSKFIDYPTHAVPAGVWLCVVHVCCVATSVPGIVRRAAYERSFDSHPPRWMVLSSRHAAAFASSCESAKTLPNICLFSQMCVARVCVGWWGCGVCVARGHMHFGKSRACELLVHTRLTYKLVPSKAMSGVIMTAMCVALRLYYDPLHSTCARRTFGTKSSSGDAATTRALRVCGTRAVSLSMSSRFVPTNSTPAHKMSVCVCVWRLSKGRLFMHAPLDGRRARARLRVPDVYCICLRRRPSSQHTTPNHVW